MGEVRIRVSLVNGVDEAMVRRGQMASEAVRETEVDAVVDTGAVTCVLPASVAAKLGLGRAFRQVAVYADGRREEVDVSDPVLFEIDGRKAYEECLILGDEVLIGQTILEKMDLQVDCRAGRLRPNPKHPDRPVMPVRQLIEGSPASRAVV